MSKLTDKTRFNSAAISKNGQYIVSAHQTTDGINSLQLIDATDGHVIKVYDNPYNAFFSMAQFDESGEHIIALKHHHIGKQITLIDVESGEEEIVLYSDKENLGHPVATSKYVFYSSNLNGIDNIYAFDRQTQQSYIITQSKYGAFLS